MKKFITIICLGFLSFNVYSESVYTYDLKKDIIIGTLAIGMFVSPFFISNQPANIPTGLQKNDVNTFDRAFILSYNKPIDKISDYGVYALLAFPVISLAGQIKDG